MCVIIENEFSLRHSLSPSLHQKESLIRGNSFCKKTMSNTKSELIMMGET